MRKNHSGRCFISNFISSLTMKKFKNASPNENWNFRIYGLMFKNKFPLDIKSWYDSSSQMFSLIPDISNVIGNIYLTSVLAFEMSRPLISNCRLKWSYYIVGKKKRLLTNYIVTKLKLASLIIIMTRDNNLKSCDIGRINVLRCDYNISTIHVKFNHGKLLNHDINKSKNFFKASKWKKSQKVYLLLLNSKRIITSRRKYLLLFLNKMQYIV